jgi:serine/threonine protein kinase
VYLLTKTFPFDSDDDIWGYRYPLLQLFFTQKTADKLIYFFLMGLTRSQITTGPSPTLDKSRFSAAAVEAVNECLKKRPEDRASANEWLRLDFATDDVIPRAEWGLTNDHVILRFFNSPIFQFSVFEFSDFPILRFSNSPFLILRS